MRTIVGPNHSWLLLLATVATAAGASCCHQSDPGTDEAAAGSASAPDPTPADPPSVEVPPAPRRSLEAGSTGDDGTWLPAFDALRPPDAAGTDWLDARKACADAGLQMCTERQWHRVCEDDASLGSHPHWTVTASGSSGFVVRGGSDCASRVVSAGFDVKPDRSVLCCSRAIGIRSSNRSGAFLRATASKLGTFESALNRRDADAAASMFDRELRFYQRDVTRDEARSRMSASFRTYPDQWAVHDVCDVSLQITGDPDRDSWTADCTKLVYRTGEVGVTRTVYVFGGPRTLVRSLTEPRILRAWAPP